MLFHEENMNNLSTSVNSSLEWRRNKVQELASHGYNQSEISRILQISQPTINRDIAYLRQQAKDTIKRYIDERLPARLALKFYHFRENNEY
jgi:DNA-binding transcriptional regulator LsrR (DeoR family)